jgi:hypothetical protein
MKGKRQKDIKTGRQADIKTERQKDKKTERQIKCSTFNNSDSDLASAIS